MEDLSGQSFGGVDLKRLIRRDNHADVYEAAVGDEYFTALSLRPEQLHHRQQDPPPPPPQQQRLCLEARVYNLHGISGKLLKARKRNLNRLATSRAKVEITVETSFGERAVVIYKPGHHPNDSVLEVNATRGVANEDGDAGRRRKWKAEQQRRRRRMRAKNGKKDDDDGNSPSHSAVEEDEADATATASSKSRKKPTQDERVVSFLDALLREKPKTGDINADLPSTPRQCMTTVRKRYLRLIEMYDSSNFIDCWHGGQEPHPSVKGADQMHSLRWWKSQTASLPRCPVHPGLDTIAEVQALLYRIRIDLAFLAKSLDGLNRLRARNAPLPRALYLVENNEATKEALNTSAATPLGDSDGRDWMFGQGTARISQMVLTARSFKDALEFDLRSLSFGQTALRLEEMLKRNEGADKDLVAWETENLEAMLRDWRLWKPSTLEKTDVYISMHFIMWYTIFALRNGWLDS